jgi:amino acid adenylation domain-containing protein
LDSEHGLDKTSNRIGKPIANVNFYVLDDHLKNVPQGEIGTLYVSGIALARGYLNQPELTADAFISNPFDTDQFPILYKTGDLVCQLDDAQFQFIGRDDRQIKIRGYRVELGEVETALSQADGIQHALVQVQEYQGQTALIAYIEPQIDEEECLERVASEIALFLPEYMLPAAYVCVTEWPLTLSGKIDNQRLPKPSYQLPNRAYVAAKTSDEKQLQGIWSDIFKQSDIGIEDDFFALGGDSISAIRFMSILRNKMNRHLKMKAFKLNATIKGVLAVSERDEISALTSLVPTKDQTEFLLSNQQMVAWYMHKNQPESKAYLAEAATHFKGEFSIQALSASINQIIKRHDIYRSVFVEKDDLVIQKVLPHFELDLKRINAEHIPIDEKEAFLEQAFKTELPHILDLGTLPLAEFILVTFSQTHHVLLHQEHHIIHDGWSANEFTGELIARYHAVIDPDYVLQPDTQSQYSHFVMSQQAWLKTEAANNQKHYWAKQLENASQGVSLFGKKSQTLGFSGSHEKMVFTRDEWNEMEALCRQIGITAFSFTSSILYLCLWRYSGETDLSFGSAFANRNWSNSHSTLGMFVNTVVLRQKIEHSESVYQFLKETQKIVDQAQANEELPFPLVVEALNPERRGASNPFFNVLLGFHDTPIYSDSMSDLAWYKDETVISDTAKFDIDCLVVPRGKTFNESEEVHFLWEYRDDIYDEKEMSQFLNSFKTLFLETVNSFDSLSEQAISVLNPISTPDQKTLIEDWGRGLPLANKTIDDFAASNIVQQIQTTASVTPNKIAIICQGESLSYEKLETCSNFLARFLQQEGIQLNDKIAIICKRNHYTVIAMLAAFKVGACAVMLGTDLPEQRERFIIKDSKATFILTDQSNVSSSSKANNVIKLDQTLIDNAFHQKMKAINTSQATSAYIIYTSGSTGTPKGIEVSHKSLYNTSLWHMEQFALTENSIGTSLAYVGFDAFMAEIWPILLAKGQVLMIDDEHVNEIEKLISLMRQKQVTHTCIPTGLLTLACAHNVVWPDSIQTVLTGGDVLGDIVFPADFKADFYNLYGPTETTIDATFYKANPHDLKNVPIGRPIANGQVRVVANGQLAPIGVPGELYVGGAGVSLGYINNPELNTQCFIQDESLSSQNQQEHGYYRTGDLVKWNSEGQLEFLGRLNDEVKVRGYRVALGEINSTLQLNEEILQAITLVENNALYSYVALTVDESKNWQLGLSNERKLTRQLRRQLKKSLPDYMRPNAIIVIERVPLTVQGKIDKAKLPSPVTQSSEFESPSSQTEIAICNIWQTTLTKSNISVADNFFSIGGHSLLAMRIISLLRDRFQVELKVSDFFVYPTIKALAGFVDMIVSVQQNAPSDLIIEEGEI